MRCSHAYDEVRIESGRDRFRHVLHIQRLLRLAVLAVMSRQNQGVRFEVHFDAHHALVGKLRNALQRVAKRIAVDHDRNRLILREHGRVVGKLASHLPRGQRFVRNPEEQAVVVMSECHHAVLVRRE